MDGAEKYRETAPDSCKQLVPLKGRVQCRDQCRPAGAKNATTLKTKRETFADVAGLLHNLAIVVEFGVNIARAESEFSDKTKTGARAPVVSLVITSSWRIKMARYVHEIAITINVRRKFELKNQSEHCFKFVHS